MTTPLIPEAIFGLFKDEIKKINTVVVTRLCGLYGLDVNDALQKLDEKANISLVLENTEVIKLVKKKKELETGERCIARLYKKKEMDLVQCSRRYMEGGCFCKLHQRMHDQGRLKYGTVNEDKPEEVSTPKLIKKKKITIF